MVMCCRLRRQVVHLAYGILGFVLVTAILLSPNSGVSGWSLSDCTGGRLTRHEILKRSSFALLSPLFWPVVVPQALAETEGLKKTLVFIKQHDGLQYADIRVGTKSAEQVQKNSKVTFHVVGRLLGKQGWMFMNTQEQDDDPYRLQFGAGQVIPGLEEGMLGMRVGGTRRIVIPSSLGYNPADKSLEPIPRDFGNRQRLYTTVFNSGRLDREREALGSDLAGVVVLDVEALRIRNE